MLTVSVEGIFSKILKAVNNQARQGKSVNQAYKNIKNTLNNLNLTAEQKKFLENKLIIECLILAERRA